MNGKIKGGGGGGRERERGGGGGEGGGGGRGCRGEVTASRYVWSEFRITILLT